MSAALHDIKRWAPQSTRAVDPMLARAQRNYPDSAANQIAWLKAVRIVRATKRGWRLDNPLTRGNHA